MQSQHIPMPIEAFDRMPMKPGWKYEYWDGCAHITPGHQIVTVTIDVTPRPVAEDFRIRPIQRDDQIALTAAYLEAFRATVEYCDWPDKQIMTSAQETVAHFFEGQRGEPLPVSRLAVDFQAVTPQESIAGAALIVKKKNGRIFLDVLFVAPRWQRRGLATALVSSVMNELHHLGIPTLRSCYVLANESSRAWHTKFGFVMVPDLLLARHCYQRVKQERWRQEQFGGVTDAERQQLLAEIQNWEMQLDELEKIAEQQGFEAVSPILQD